MNQVSILLEVNEGQVNFLQRNVKHGVPLVKNSKCYVYSRFLWLHCYGNAGFVEQKRQDTWVT